MSFLSRASALVSRSIYDGLQRLPGWPLESPVVESIREFLGGNLATLPSTQLEWILEDVDEASRRADMGDLTMAAQLARAFRRDSVIKGLNTTKFGGVTRLPKLWHGDEEVVSELTRNDDGVTVFDLLCPVGELVAMAADADAFRIAFGELVPVQGRDYPVLERKDPEYFFYLWNYNQWFMRSTAGIIPWTPGDGRCVIHYAGPRIAPWQFGNWHSVGRSWVRKDSNQSLKDNWAFTLANAARVATSTRAATPSQNQRWFSQIAAWGINNVFFTPEGFDVKILETNGRGWEGFDTSIEQADRSFMIDIAGQIVSVTGGSGFTAKDLYETIRLDLISDTADPLAHTVSTQILPYYTWLRHPDKLNKSPGYKYEVKNPSDLAKEVSTYTALGSGLKDLEMLANRQELQVNIRDKYRQYGIKLEPISDSVKANPIEPKQDVAKAGVDAAQPAQPAPKPKAVPKKASDDGDE